MTSENYLDIPVQSITSPEFCVGFPYLKLTSNDFELSKSEQVYFDYCEKLENIAKKENLIVGENSFFQIQPRFSNGQPIRGLLGFHLALKIIETNTNIDDNFYFDIKSNWDRATIKAALSKRDYFASWVKLFSEDEDNDYFSENYLTTSITLFRGERLNSNAFHLSPNYFTMHLYNHFNTNNQRVILECVLKEFKNANQEVLNKYNELSGSALYLFLICFCREFNFSFTPFWDLVSQENLFYDFNDNTDKILFSQISFQFIENLRVRTGEYNSNILNQTQSDIENLETFNSKYNIYSNEALTLEDEYTEYLHDSALHSSLQIEDVSFVAEESITRIEDDYYDQYTATINQEIVLPPITFSINKTAFIPINIVNIVEPKLTQDECWNYINKEWGHLIRSFKEDFIQLKEQKKINQVSTILVNLKSEILSHTDTIDNGYSQIQYIDSISFHTYNSIWSSFFEKTIRTKLIDYIVENSELPPLSEEELIKKKLRTELENNQFEAIRPNKFKASLNSLFEAIEKIMVDAFILLANTNKDGDKSYITNHDVKLMSTWYFKSFIQPIMVKEKRIDKLIEIAQAEVNTVLHSSQRAMSVVYEANLLTSKKYDPHEILA